MLWRKIMKLFFDEHETKKKWFLGPERKAQEWLACCKLYLWEFFSGSTNKPLIDVFLYSHHSSAWNCIYIVRRNSVLVTHGYMMIRLNQLMLGKLLVAWETKRTIYRWDRWNDSKFFVSSVDWVPFAFLSRSTMYEETPGEEGLLHFKYSSNKSVDSFASFFGGDKSLEVEWLGGSPPPI